MTTLTAVEQDQDLASLIDLYLLRCQVEGKSPNTITAYRETLTILQRIAREEGFPEDVRAITPTQKPGGSSLTASWKSSSASCQRSSNGRLLIRHRLQTGPPAVAAYQSGAVGKAHVYVRVTKQQRLFDHRRASSRSAPDSSGRHLLRQEVWLVSDFRTMYKRFLVDTSRPACFRLRLWWTAPSPRVSAWGQPAQQGASCIPEISGNDFLLTTARPAIKCYPRKRRGGIV